MNQKTATNITFIRVLVFTFLGFFILFSGTFEDFVPWQRYGLAGIMFAYAALRGFMFWQVIKKNKEK